MIGKINVDLFPNVKPPCKDCESRYIGCHASCKGYLEFREVVDEKRRTAGAQKIECDDYYFAQRFKHKKRREV